MNEIIITKLISTTSYQINYLKRSPDQTMDSAFGFTIDMYGPTSLRRNNLTLLRESNINNRLSALFEENELSCIIFKDSAYSSDSHLRS